MTILLAVTSDHISDAIKARIAAVVPADNMASATEVATWENEHFQSLLNKDKVTPPLNLDGSLRNRIKGNGIEVQGAKTMADGNIKIAITANLTILCGIEGESQDLGNGAKGMAENRYARGMMVIKPVSDDGLSVNPLYAPCKAYAMDLESNPKTKYNPNGSVLLGAGFNTYFNQLTPIGEDGYIIMELDLVQGTSVENYIIQRIFATTCSLEKTTGSSHTAKVESAWDFRDKPAPVAAVAAVAPVAAAAPLNPVLATPPATLQRKAPTTTR